MVAALMTGWTRYAFVLTVGLAAAALGCGGGRSASTAPSRAVGVKGSIAVNEDRFPHAKHTGNDPRMALNGKALECVDCHAAADVKAGVVARPGGAISGPSIQQHAPCDSCHKDEFAKPPGKMCKICHDSVDPTVKGAVKMKRFPEAGIVQALAANFSHRQHLDSGAMEKATGHHVACGDCHMRDADSRDPILPSHKQCLTCHENAPAAKAALPMDKCAGCHPQRDVEIKRGRIFITGDLKFAHKTHETDKSGQQIACNTCHKGVDESSTRDDMAVPSMEKCAQCHEDDHRSPARVRMENCGVCHEKIDSGTPPANHGVSGALPTDHTLEFRKNHAVQAADKDANCRFCHLELSGRHEDSCFQCHATMKPRDHNLMFRDDHGREAEADGTKCATCHAPETCTACHSIPPRSHTPIGDFRLGGHAEQARFELTACLTCHTYATTCAQCHRGGR
jgi:hypothetical protein